MSRRNPIATGRERVASMVVRTMAWEGDPDGTAHPAATRVAASHAQFAELAAGAIAAHDPEPPGHAGEPLGWWVIRGRGPAAGPPRHRDPRAGEHCAVRRGRSRPRRVRLAAA